MCYDKIKAGKTVGGTEMKLLIYQWNSYFQYDIYSICNEKSIQYQVFEWKFQNKNQDEEFQKWFNNSISSKEFDAVLSVNYYPVISDVCAKKQMKYIAWCYDNPLNVERIEETINYERNYVFLFDRVQYSGYAQKGFDTVYYLPLGVNKNRLANIEITRKEYEKYFADVSFVGNLYESKFQELTRVLNEYTRGYINSLMDIQSQIYGCYFLDELISEELVDDINSQYRALNPETKLMVNKAALTFSMASEITRNERLILLNLCGKRYTTKFYSYDDSELIKNVQKCGALDYVLEMPKVFASSKINLNPSLRSIQTGIPLRALDIMGAGGFLLSNYQQELVEYYENERDMVVYESIEDAMEKIRFYLANDNLRMKIAENGKRRTLDEHTLQKCFEKITEIAEL